jgi:hypothetical protein
MDFDGQFRRKAPDRGVEVQGETTPRRDGVVTRRGRPTPTGLTRGEAEERELRVGMNLGLAPLPLGLGATTARVRRRYG